MKQAQAQALTHFWGPIGGAGGEVIVPPDSFPNMRAWWRADSLVFNDGLADNDPVPSWTDKLQGRVASQANAGNRPVLKTNQTGGRPCVRFSSASSQFLAIASSMQFTGDFTFYAFYYEPVTGSPVWEHFLGGPSGTADHRYKARLSVKRGGGGELAVQMSIDANYQQDRSFTAYMPPSGGCPHSNHYFYVFRRQGNVYRGGLMRGLQYDQFFAGVGGESVTVDSIGKAETTYLNADLFEVGVYDRYMTDSEIEMLWGMYILSYYQSYPGRFAYVDYDSLTVGWTVNGRAGGSKTHPSVAWVQPHVAGTVYAPFGVSDDMDHYDLTDELNGLNGGDSTWVAAGGYVARTA